MNTTLPYLAMTMGLLSSFHCIGMCGPIALALPVQRGSRWQQFSGLLTYNVGRTLSYAGLGAIVGIFGSSIALLGYLKSVSVFAGILMLGYVFWPNALTPYLRPPKFLQRTIGQIKKNMSALLHSRNMHGLFFLGMLNGMLPCGLVYLALASSIATGSISGGAFYMFIFGTGTLPAMMAVGFFKNWITPAIRTRFHQITPVFIACAGIWLLYRSTLIQYPKTSAPEITICHGE